MGYYSTIDPQVKVKPEHIGRVTKITESANMKAKADISDYLIWHLSEMMVLSNGNIDFFEYYQKWYDDEKLARLLAPFVKKGIIEFVGDDGDRWGYWFDGKGGLYELIYPAPVKGKRLK